MFQASLRGAGRGARSLSPRPFQGLLETLQNADDLGATELRIAIRRRADHEELLIVHNGQRVQLHHAGAMVLPWLSTKENEADASGRFGIGQQTLKSLGGPLEVHCEPFAFRLEEDGPVVLDPLGCVPGLYDPSRHETLFVLPLLRPIDEDLRRFVAGLGPESLLFLKSVRRICLIGRDGGTPQVDQRLADRRREVATLVLFGEPAEAERTSLSAEGGLTYVRFRVQRRLGEDAPTRLHKATAEATPLGIALTLHRQAQGGIYDRLPLPLRTGLAASLNAQFDPDAPRTTLLENEWNEARLQDLGELLAAASLELFSSDPALAWWAIPLKSDLQVPAGTWLGDHLRTDVVQRAQQQILERLRLPAGGATRPLSEIAYEEEALDGLLGTADLEWLHPGRSALGAELRDASGRWRTVLGELGTGARVDVVAALKLFDLGEEALSARDPEWFVGMARAAVEADELETLLWCRSILLQDGRRIDPPRHADPWSLVCRTEEGSLASVLGLALAIHPAYLAGAGDAAIVERALREAGVLLDDVAADKALDLLARDTEKNTRGRIRLEDSQLLALRDAFFRRDPEERGALAPRAGRTLSSAGFGLVSAGGGRRAGCVRPRRICPRPLTASGTASRPPPVRPRVSHGWTSSTPDFSSMPGDARNSGLEASFDSLAQPPRLAWPSRRVKGSSRNGRPAPAFPRSGPARPSRRRLRSGGSASPGNGTCLRTATRRTS